MASASKDTIMPHTIVSHMLQHDLFSQWLGIDVLELSAGYCRLKMQVRDEMCNGFGIAHGGISYSLADSALAFASNSHGKKAVSIETSISHLKPVKSGDVLWATAVERHMAHKIAVYDISITNQQDMLVALFKGTVYRTNEDWAIAP